MSFRSFGLGFWFAFGNNGGMGCMISTVYDVTSMYRNIIYSHIAINISQPADCFLHFEDPLAATEAPQKWLKWMQIQPPMLDMFDVF